MPAGVDNSEWDLPRLRASFGFEDDFKYLSSDDGAQEFFDVKFYPYNPPGASPVFAAAVVCRLSQSKDNVSSPCEVIRIIRDDDPDASNCTCCWSKDPETERALLCVAGHDAKMKVYDAKEGKLVKTLVGHGGGINDLATSPDNPLIIASASDDTTVRIWSLAIVHERQPCLCLLGGEGHSWDLLGVAFHDTGRYVLSTGHDQVINLWTLPDLAKEHTDAPIVVYYPHFSSSEIHSGLVDCVAFLGDCILSRACHEEIIVLWRIEGFSSEDPPPPASQAPTTYDPSKLTRSAFAPAISSSCPAQYTRLLEFEAAGCGPQFFMRFRAYEAPGKHPVLAFCNAKSKTFFWDLARLTSYHEFMTALNNPNRRDKDHLEKPAWLNLRQQRRTNNSVPARVRDPSDGDSMVSFGAGSDPDNEPGATAGINPKSISGWDELYGISSPQDHPIRPHKTVGVTGESQFVGRQVAWSPEGEWCVVVGSQNRALIFQRWAKEKAAQ